LDLDVNAGKTQLLLPSIKMRCALVLYAAALVGLSTAGWQQYGVGGYSGQQMPVSYYLPVPSNMYTGHQQMYVPGQQQMYVPGHQHMYVPQYYQPQLAAAYPVRQTSAHQVRPMVVSPQVQQVPMLNQDMEAEASCTYSMRAIMYISNSVVNDGYNHADSCEAYKLRTEYLMRATINIAHHSEIDDNSCRFSKGAIRYISNFVISANPSDSCEAYKRRTDKFMRATVNICQSYIVPDCRDSMQAIGYLRNFVVKENSLYPCEAYKPRTDNYMMTVTNICNSYLTSSAPDASCKSAMVSIMSVSYSVRNDNPSDSCEAYKLRIINFMNDIKDITSRW